MIRHISFFLLQLKSALRLIPKFMAGTVIFACLAALIGYAGSKTLYAENRGIYITFAIVLPENDNMVRLAYNMFTEIENIKQYCDFIDTDEATARELLREGKIYGIAIVPDGFIEDILTGVNTPARIILTDNAGMETMLFKSVLNAGASTLSYAQSGIYAVSDTYIKYGVTDAFSDTLDKVNSDYIRFVLNRSSFMDKTKVSSTNLLAIPQFFACAGIVLLMLFSGITLGEYVCQEDDNIGVMLKRSGISTFYTALCKTISVTLLHGIIFLAFIGIIQTALRQLPPPYMYVAIRDIFIDFDAHNISTFLLCTALSVSFIMLVFRLAGNGLYGVLLLFSLNVSLLFVSGCIIPSAYLPKVVASVGEVFPTAYMRRLLEGVYTGSVDRIVYVISGIYIIIFTIINAVCRSAKRG